MSSSFSRHLASIDEEYHLLHGSEDFSSSLLPEEKELIRQEFNKQKTSGLLQELQYQNYRKTIELFSTVFGIDEKKAQLFYQEGCRTLSDLQASPRLTSAQRIGLHWWKDLQERIPRSEIDDYANFIEECFSSLRRKGISIVWDIAGSYRRKESSSGDIDVIICTEAAISTLVDSLAGILVGKLAAGKVLFLGVSKLNSSTPARRLDLLRVPAESYYFALLYFTGSDKFNILLRRQANKLGLRLNQLNFTSLANKQVVSFPIASEEDIFSILGVDYLLPEERTRKLTSLSLIEK